MAEPTPMTQAEQIAKLEQEIRSWQITVENRDSEILQLKAELEAVGAGGVQALRSPLKTAEGVAPDKTAVCDSVQTDGFGKPTPQPQVEPAGGISNEDVQDLVSLALRKAWQLGQTYWQQADSEFISQQNKSDATQAKFQVLIDETRAALATIQPAPAGEYPAPTTLSPRSHFIKGWDAAFLYLGMQRNVDTDIAMRGYMTEIPCAYADATHAMRAGEQEPVANCYSDDDGDTWRDSPGDCDFVDGLKLGEEFELQASIRSWPEAFRVTKVPDDDSDDYEVEPVSIRVRTSPVATQGEQDALDAKRYRYIRDNPWTGTPLERVIALHLNACWDSAIDAALSATAPPVAKDE